jgi:hypothetical protein
MVRKRAAVRCAVALAIVQLLPGCAGAPRADAQGAAGESEVTVSDITLSSGPALKSDAELSPKLKDACRRFREKAGRPRIEEALMVMGELQGASLPVALAVDLLGEPRSRTDTSLTYSLGHQNGTASALHLRIHNGRATILGMGGGG